MSRDSNTIRSLKSFDWAKLEAEQENFRKALGEDGIAVVRNVLSLDEVTHLRGTLNQYLSQSGRRMSLGKTQPNAAQKVPELSIIFSHPRIVSVVKTVLGPDNVSFTGHCDIHKNMLSGWHKDSGESVPGGYFQGDYFGADACQVFKVAIYLQDTGPRDSFTACLGSHRTPQLHTGNVAKVASRLGDTVVFDVRLSHTGQLPDFVEKGLKSVSLFANGMKRDAEDPRLISAAKALYWKSIGRRDRLSIFFTYGAKNTFTDDFAAANMLRQERQGGGDTVGFPEELRRDLSRQGVGMSLVSAGIDDRP